MDTSMLLTQWHAYCNGSDDFEGCDFLTLLHDDPRLTFDQLLDAFQYFDEGETLAKAVHAAQSIRYDNRYLPMTKNVASNLVRQHLLGILDKLDVSLDKWLDEALITSAPVHITTDGDQFFSLFSSIENVSSAADNEWGSFIHEATSSEYFDDPFEGLRESLYGFANNLLLSDYFLQPILKSDVNLGNYFRLWQSGVMYVLTKDKLVLYTKPDSKVS